MKSGVAVREYVNYVCDELGVPQVGKAIDIEWSNRMTRVMGWAKVLSLGYPVGRMNDCRTGFRAKVQFSSKIFELAGEKEQDETVVHEVCHVVARYLDNQLVARQGLKGHGQFWASLMNKVGCPPTRYHCVNTISLRKKVQRVNAYCQCDKPMEITLNRATKMMKGYAYRCIKCKSLISLRDNNAKY